MTIYGPIEVLIVAMLAPFRFGRIAAPLILLLTVTLLIAAFQTEDSSVFGIPIDYATIGMRLPDAVLREQGWSGLGIWIGTSLFFLGGLGFWSLALAKEFHPFQRTWTPGRTLRRVTLFIVASLLVPTMFVSIVLLVLLDDLETIFLRGSAFAPAQEEPLALLQDVTFIDLALFTPPAALITWLILRLAIWPTIVLMIGWRHSLRTAWRTSQGLAGRWLCHFLVAALIVRKVFDLVALVLYELQWQLLDMPAFDTAVLLSIASEGIVCTVFLGFWMNAVMVLHVPENVIERDTVAADIF